MRPSTAFSKVTSAASADDPGVVKSPRIDAWPSAMSCDRSASALSVRSTCATALTVAETRRILPTAPTPTAIVEARRPSRFNVRLELSWVLIVVKCRAIQVPSFGMPSQEGKPLKRAELGRTGRNCKSQNVKFRTVDSRAVAVFGRTKQAARCRLSPRFLRKRNRVGAIRVRSVGASRRVKHTMKEVPRDS